MKKDTKKAISNQSTDQKSLRLWPGIVIVVLQWLVWIFLQKIFSEALEISVFSGFVGWLAVVIWWVFFSRAPRFERWGAVVLMIAMIILIFFFLHESISTAMMGMMFPVYVTPFLSLAFVMWAVASQYLTDKIRRPAMIATIVFACGVWVLLRTDGMTGDVNQDITWRWADTSEERLLAQSDDEMFEIPPDFVMDTLRAIWPGFRGPNRDAIIRDVRIETDWSETPPVELWRRPIGPGISSFAVLGDFFYTQEQRGEMEMVACYHLSTGKPVWRHGDTSRFWDSHAGAGPRGTPTVRDGCIYSLGPTGILNVLNASDGKVVWSRNTVSDTEVEIPEWGISSSPLIAGDIVYVALVGKLAAYDRYSGDPLWFGRDGGASYSSPHLMTIDRIKQVVLMGGNGVISFTPDDGKQLWEYAWPPGARIVQPALTTGGDLLIGGGQLNGIRRISVMQGSDGWTIEERWTSKKLKPYYNDFVVHEGHIYGFNGSRVVCIDVENGNRKWTGERYGYGQLVILADQDLLLVVSEEGELALAAATPDQFKELSRISAIEGKTWNHPVLIGSILLVRNSQEMVAFRLSLMKG
jgi:outer membrane protein assembly factor BamB